MCGGHIVYLCCRCNISYVSNHVDFTFTYFYVLQLFPYILGNVWIQNFENRGAQPYDSPENPYFKPNFRWLKRVKKCIQEQNGGGGARAPPAPRWPPRRPPPPPPPPRAPLWIRHCIGWILLQIFVPFFKLLGLHGSSRVDRGKTDTGGRWAIFCIIINTEGVVVW